MRGRPYDSMPYASGCQTPTQYPVGMPLVHTLTDAGRLCLTTWCCHTQRVPTKASARSAAWRPVYNANIPMTDAAEGRSVSTRFRILVEIASRQPSVQQKDVARELGITVQAVSERMKELVAAGLVVSRSRSSYSVTPSGVDWLLRHARELESYSERISRIVRDISVTAAVADGDLAQGRKVSLEMRDGLLHARPWSDGAPASGIAVANADAGTDAGITRIEGVIPLAVTEVVIATLPTVQDGGSRRADSPRLRRLAQKSSLVASMGVESLVALQLADVELHIRWASPAAVIEAASSGVSCLLVCTEADLPRVSERLAEAGLQFSVVDLSLPTTGAT